MFAITHIVRHGLVLPLTDHVVDLEFVGIVGHLDLNDLAAFGSAALGDND